MMTEAVEDLTTTLNEAASAAGVVGGMVDSITQAINQVRALAASGHGLPWSADFGLSVAVVLTVFLFARPLPQLDEGPMGEPEGSFVDYQTTMVRTAKAIAVTVQEMVSLGHKRTTLESRAWSELHFFPYH